MRQLLTILGIGLLMITACQPDAASDSQAEATNTESTAATNNGGSAIKPVSPNMQVPEAKHLVKDYWVAEFWVDNRNEANNAPNRGRWWKLEPDGTMTTGQWEEVKAKGSWSIVRGQQYSRLYLDADVDAYDCEFDIQGITGTGDVMSWVGTSTFSQLHIAVKAMNLMTMPTKKQFGLE